MNNTIVDVDGGIQVPQSVGSVQASNNIILRVARAALSLEGGGVTPKVEMNYSLYDAMPKVVAGGIAQPVERGRIAAGHNLIAAPKFVDAALGDFRLQPGSPGTAAGIAVPVSDAYRAIHGVDLGLDLTGTPNLGAPMGARAPAR